MRTIKTYRKVGVFYTFIKPLVHFGVMITVDRAARLTETTEIRSALPASKSIQSQVAALSSVRSLLRPHCFAELAAVGCGSPK